MSKVNNYLHIVFRTYRSKTTIPQNHKRALLTYLLKFCKSKGVYLKRENAHLDHVHLLINLPASIALADFMAEMKSWSSKMLRESPNFPDFEGWARGYGAFSLGYKDLDVVTAYIANQDVHHTKENVCDEFRRLLVEHGETVTEYFDEDL